MTTQKSLYPGSLFHFTDKGGLFSILESTFKVSYAREKISGYNQQRDFAVPMVSFCDLRISELNVHMSKYGKYGIGLTKEWANRKGLNPVMYVNKHCPFTNDFIKAIDGIYRHLNLIEDENEFQKLNIDYMNVLNVYRYLKNYEGELIRSDAEIDPNYRFADEREWRFVPPLGSSGFFPFLPISRVRTKRLKAEENNRISNIRLEFEPDDIKYLIIKSESEIPLLIEHLRIVKDKFDQQTIDKLLCRILTYDQIYSDI